MKNFVFISPHFPDSFYRFVVALKKNGFRVLGIGDDPYENLRPELKEALTEYYQSRNRPLSPARIRDHGRRICRTQTLVPPEH